MNKLIMKKFTTCSCFNSVNSGVAALFTTNTPKKALNCKK